MTIQADLDYIMIKHSGVPDLDISYLAHVTLERFQQVRQAVSGNESQKLELFEVADFIPPTLRQIVKDYRSRKTDQKETLMLIAETRSEAEYYLIANGYNPDGARSDEDQSERTIITFLKDILNNLKNPPTE